MIKRIYNWFKTKIKWLLIGSVALTVAGDLAIATEGEFITKIRNRQETFLTQGQYRHIPLNQEKIGLKKIQYQINEYLKPDGKRGYQIIINYPDKTVSFGYGPEAAERTFIIPAFVNSTSTPQ